eukprot:365534-Chlamydomonas_euryale.AAC.12
MAFCTFFSSNWMSTQHASACPGEPPTLCAWTSCEGTLACCVPGNCVRGHYVFSEAEHGRTLNPSQGKRARVHADADARAHAHAYAQTSSRSCNRACPYTA